MLITFFLNKPVNYRPRLILVSNLLQIWDRHLRWVNIWIACVAARDYISPGDDSKSAKDMYRMREMLYCIWNTGTSVNLWLSQDHLFASNIDKQIKIVFNTVYFHSMFSAIKFLLCQLLICENQLPLPYKMLFTEVV